MGKRGASVLAFPEEQSGGEVHGQCPQSFYWAMGSPGHSPSALGLTPLLDITWLLLGRRSRLPHITHVCALAWHREYYPRVRASPSAYSFPFFGFGGRQCYFFPPGWDDRGSGEWGGREAHRGFQQGQGIYIHFFFFVCLFRFSF